MQNFDILTLQEVFYTLNDRKESLIQYAAQNGFPFSAKSCFPKMHSPFVVDGALLTLSRFPIVEQEYQPYEYGVFSYSTANKGILYTKIKIQEEYILLFNTHTNASYVSPDFQEGKASIETRVFQFEQVRHLAN